MSDCSLSSSSLQSECFCSSQLAETSLKKMNSYFLAQQLTDVVLIAGNKRISAHRLVLSAGSDYFAAMFTSDLKEATQSEIELKNVNEDALWNLVQYCYTGTIELTEENVETLLGTACLLQLFEVVDACCSFLKKQLDPSNCIGIQQFADLQGFTDLMQTSCNYIADHFLEVVRNQEFLMLSADQFSKLLASDDLNVSSEEDIFNALMSWLEHDLPNRTEYVSRLLSSVRLPLLQPSFIVDHIESNPLFRDNPECRELITEAFKYHLLPERRSVLQSPRIFPRKSTLDTLYAVGGMNSREREISIEKYSARFDKWTYDTNTSIERLQVGVVAAKDKIYVVGGRDGLKTLNTVKCYCVKSKTWIKLPGMSTTRHGLGVAILEGPLYAVGGHDGWRYLSTVERWDPQTNMWSYVAPMLSQRSTLGVAVLNGKLYAVGGRDGSSSLNTVECYDPHTDRWVACAPMNKRRSSVGVGVLHGYLYAVGGHDTPTAIASGNRLASVERYNPKKNVWEMVASMSTGRDAVGVCLLGERLLAVGGYDGKFYLRLVEAYDPKENKWHKMQSLIHERAGAGIVSIKN